LNKTSGIEHFQIPSIIQSVEDLIFMNGTRIET